MKTKLPNKKIDKQYDLERLGKIIKNLNECCDFFYHMDSREYSRMRDFINNRFDIHFPFYNPTIKYNVQLKELNKNACSLINNMMTKQIKLYLFLNCMKYKHQ